MQKQRANAIMTKNDEMEAGFVENYTELSQKMHDIAVQLTTIDDAAKEMALLMATEAEADGYPDTPIDDYIEYALEDIADIPSADVAPVVRCKDCVFGVLFQNDNSGATARYCEAFTIERMVADNDFCSYGERKDNDTD